MASKRSKVPRENPADLVGYGTNYYSGLDKRSKSNGRSKVK